MMTISSQTGMQSLAGDSANLAVGSKITGSLACTVPVAHAAQLVRALGSGTAPIPDAPKTLGCVLHGVARETIGCALLYAGRARESWSRRDPHHTLYNPKAARVNSSSIGEASRMIQVSPGRMLKANLTSLAISESSVPSTH
jgi:hypothetical protein